MATHNITPQEWLDAEAALAAAGDKRAHAAKAMGISRGAFCNRLDRGRALYAGKDKTDDVGWSAPPPPLSRDERSEIKDLRAKVEELSNKNQLLESIFADVESGSERFQPVFNRALDDETASAAFFLSDLHWFQRVLLHETDGINEFNPEIASERLQKYIEKSISLCFERRNDTKYDRAYLLLGGDMISGDIHEELRDTNALNSSRAVVDLVQHLVWAIEKIVEKFGRVTVYCVPGNHARLDKKPRSGDYADRSYEFFLYRLLYTNFKDDDRVTFVIPADSAAYFVVHHWPFLLVHGDRMGVKGGDGQIGPIGPIVRGHLKLKTKYAQYAKPIYRVFNGHYHTTLRTPNGYANGSLVGCDPYAAQVLNVAPEPATQWVFRINERHGVFDAVEIHLSDPFTPWQFVRDGDD